MHESLVEPFPVLDPFIDGQLLTLDHKYARNQTINVSELHVIRNEQNIYLKGSFPAVDSLETATIAHLSTYPGLKGLFGYTANRETSWEHMMIPTVMALSNLKIEHFSSPNYAAVRFALAEGEEFPPVQYIGHLADGELLISNDPNIYLHDIAVHALGVAIMPAKQFAVFQLLAQDAMRVYAENTQKGEAYCEDLAHVFDFCSAMFKITRSSDKFFNQYGIPLIQHTLGKLQDRDMSGEYTDLYHRARDIVATAGMTFVRDSAFSNELEPGQENFRAHYEHVWQMLSRSE